MDVQVFLCRRGLPRTGRRPRAAARVRIQPRTNLDQRIIFELDGLTFERRLVAKVEDIAGEISCHSPVGKVLLTASEGERIVVQAPGGDIVVKVLGIYDPSLTQNGGNG